MFITSKCFNSEKPGPTVPPEQAQANSVAITLTGITNDRVSSTCACHMTGLALLAPDQQAPLKNIY